MNPTYDAAVRATELSARAWEIASMAAGRAKSDDVAALEREAAALACEAWAAEWRRQRSTCGPEGWDTATTQIETALTLAGTIRRREPGQRCLIMPEDAPDPRHGDRSSP